MPFRSRVASRTATRVISVNGKGFIRRGFVLLISAAALHGTGAHASPILYTLTTTLPGMNAWTMNERGQVAGWSSTSQIAQIYTPGTGISTIPLPEGGRSTIAYSINDAGQVGGRLEGPSNYGPNGNYINWSFIYTPGATPEVRAIVGDIGFDHVLNDEGEVVKLTSPSPAGSTYTIVTSVNGNYRAGYSNYVGDHGNGRAWRLNPDGSFTDLSVLLGAPESQAYGVNSSGTVVGRRIPLNTGISAFAYSDSMGAVNLFDVTDPASRTGWVSFTSAQDITEDGRITGWGLYADKNSYSYILSGFILTPVSAVPEPSTIALWLAGAFGCFCVRRRR